MQVVAEQRFAGAPRQLLPADRLMLGTLGAMAAVALVSHPEPARFLLLFALLAAFTLAVARLAPHVRAGEAVHAFAPMVVLIGVYETVGFLVAVANPVRWDGVFAAADATLFGPLVPAWRALLGRPPWLCDLLSLCYVSYYPIPVAIGAALYASGRRRDFDRFVLALLVTFLACYAGYFLFPTSGPRVPPEEAQAVLGGGALSALVRSFISTAELNGLDAFPSGHTAVSLVFLVYGWRLLPRWRAPLALLAGGIVYSTVFLSHHYLVDVVAGGLLAAGVLRAMPRLERRLARGSRASSPAAARSAQ